MHKGDEANTFQIYDKCKYNGSMEIGGLMAALNLHIQWYLFVCMNTINLNVL